MSETYREMLDRLRRIETRLTRFMQWQGFDTQSQQPRWSGSGVVIPSLECSLKACLETIPAEHVGVVPIVHQGSVVTAFVVDTRQPRTVVVEGR